MQPIFKIGSSDFTTFVAEDGLKPVRNDLDADGSGRNLLDGRMVRNRIAQKDKWNVSFIRLPEQIMKSIAVAINPASVRITMLDPKTNRYLEKEYYTSTLNYGVQRYDKCQGITYYDGCNFDIIEV